MSDATPTTTESPAATPDQGQAPQVETFSREYVQQLRDEAAGHRVAKATAVEQAKAAKDVEWQTQVETHRNEAARLGTELGDAWVEVAKLYAALDAGVPSDKVRDFASILKGSDAESIKASAESAKALFGGLQTTVPATDPTQGSGSNTPLNGDKLLNALKAAVGA